jgi:hypothetical protein
MENIVNLRKEIEPQFDIAEQYYLEVLKLILEYTDYCDKNDDEDNIEYKKLEQKLHELTGKDMSKYNLWEWWEEDGAEVLAFRISLPDPVSIANITKNELIEIIRRKCTPVMQNKNDKTLKEQFHYLLDDYWFDFLKLNFKTFDNSLFLRNKDKNGNYFEYTQEEIVDRLWN